MADDNVDIWSLDEVHFQQYGSRCQMWVPPEIKEPVLRHHPTRKSVGYFGAVRIRDGKFVYHYSRLFCGTAPNAILAAGKGLIGRGSNSYLKSGFQFFRQKL
jgi:hypothetical protein